jgi:hypothetical protein
LRRLLSDFRFGTVSDLLERRSAVRTVEQLAPAGIPTRW